MTGYEEPRRDQQRGSQCFRYPTSSRTFMRDKSRLQLHRCVRRPMNSCPGGSFNWPCPALIAGPLRYVRWSFFHAESSILNISRRAQPPACGPHSRRAADLVSTRYPSPTGMEPVGPNAPRKRKPLGTTKRLPWQKNNPPGYAPCQRRILRETTFARRSLMRSRWSTCLGRGLCADS